LIYGFANKQLNGLLETYRALVKTVRSQFEVLVRISELRFQQVRFFSLNFSPIYFPDPYFGPYLSRPVFFGQLLKKYLPGKNPGL
jgi:hypothetical protein